MLITKLDVGHIISSSRMRLGYDGGVWIPPPWKVAVQGVTNIAKSQHCKVSSIHMTSSS